MLVLVTSQLRTEPEADNSRPQVLENAQKGRMGNQQATGSLKKILCHNTL